VSETVWEALDDQEQGEPLGAVEIRGNEDQVRLYKLA
jgi:hypothetical protein